MEFARRKPQTKQQKQAGILAAIGAVVVGLAPAITSVFTHGKPQRGGDIGSMTTRLIFAAAVALPLIVLLIVWAVRRGDHDGTLTEDSNSDSNADSSGEENEGAAPRAVLLAIMAALIALGVGLFAWVQTAHAQGAPGAQDRGAFVIHNGADTVVVDRFARAGDTLRGTLSIRGQGRVEYTVALGADNAVHSLRLAAYSLGASAADTPIQSLLTTMAGDSAIVTNGAKRSAYGTKAGAVPAINNAIAITELFTRRARASGGSGDYSYFAMAGGATLPVNVRPNTADSVILTIAGQRQHYRVDPAGRILSGTIELQPYALTRASAEETAKITFGLPSTKPAEKADYSAPPGATYTAEEVSFKGPGGITLGGTLTKPKNARGPLPAVVTITGSGQEDRDEYVPLAGGVRLFKQVADTLSRVGIAVLRLDDRGFGASTGDFAKSNTADFADDTRAAVAWLRARGDIDPNRIALVGHSEGGMIAPMVASTDPNLRAIVTVAGPGVQMLDLLLFQQRWALDHNPALTAAQRDSLAIISRAALAPEKQTIPSMKWWLSYDIRPAATKVKAATLILQGATDRQVPVENAEKLAALIRSGGNKDVTVRIFPTTDHLMLEDPTGDFTDGYAHVKSNKVSPVILGALSDWLVAKIGAPTIVK
jgi:dienelactone hydrolase